MQRSIQTFLFERSSVALALALAIVVTFAASALGETPSAYDDVNTAEGWAWSRIKQGLPADFGEHCGLTLDPRAEQDTWWRDDPCRTINASFLIDILTRAPLRDAIPYRGVMIRNAKIVGDVDLAFAKLDRPIVIEDSRFEGEVSLKYTHADNLVDFGSSLILGALNALAFRSKGDLLLELATIKGGITLANAAIAGIADMRGVSCGDALNADGIRAGALSMQSHDSSRAEFKAVTLRNARVAGLISMVGARVDGTLDAEALQVGGSLSMGSDDKYRATFKNVILNSAKIAGQINMTGASLDGVLSADSVQAGALYMRSDGKNEARFNGVLLRSAKIAGQVSIIGAQIDGPLDAGGLQASGPLLMNSYRNHKASFRAVILHGAKVMGQVNLTDASVDGPLDAEALQTGDLYLASRNDKGASFKDVSLRGAKVTGQVAMVGATVDGTLYADGLQAGSLLMRSNGSNKASFKLVRLLSAKVTGPIDLTGAIVDGDLDANALQADDLEMTSDDKSKASFKNVILRDAKVRGQVSMVGASVAGDLDADALQAGDVFMRSDSENAATFSSVNLTFATIKGGLDVRGAKFMSLDLRGASIAGEMRLGDQSHPAELDNLDLRNAHVGSLSDSRKSWPRRGALHLDGFTFARLGGFEADSTAGMVGRGADWWDQWARLDQDFSASPYEQLAAAFTASGYHDAADEIRYDEQVRADEKATGWLTFMWSQLLRWVAGYGIGSYMFRAVCWAVGLSVLGALCLQHRVKGVAIYGHGFWWCLGASANRLLPVINLKKEFSDFFEQRALNHFTPFQDFIFTMLALIGWVLGAIVIAALATITHGP